MNKGLRKFGNVQEDVAELLDKHNIFKVLIALKEYCNDCAYEACSADARSWEEIATQLSDAIDNIDFSDIED